MRTQLVGLLYRKLLRLNSAGDRTNTPGKVLNVINNDLRRIDDIFAVVALALQFPIFLAGTVYQVYTRLGVYPVLTVVSGIFITLGALMFQAVWLGSLREIIAKVLF